ncbi:phage tail protein [Ensifer sesbaniae]|uniref:phage tail protein n=1 Tax=Ensifer sesbaniae TaxID=1214071 RepID=UPI00200198E0|nr:phage tail protein [Ensifer sesbaniae]
MLFRAYLFLVFFLVLFAGSAEAAPIFGAIAAIGSAISSFVGASVIGGIIVKTVLSIGMSLVQQAIARKKAKKNQQRVGVVLDTQTGDDQPMSVIVGSRATAGRRKYWGTWGSANGTPNAYFTDVIEIGSLPSYAGPLGITSLWCNEEKCGVLWGQPHPDGRGYPVLEFRDSKGRDNLWIRYLDGTQAVADPWLRATFGAHADRPFLASMIGRGCQVLIVTARYSDKFNGAPAMLVEPHPYRFYDLRKDSTNGGSGTHRWNDPSTWEPTRNPIIMIYNIARGMYYGGEWVYGGQNVGAHRLPAASWIAAANECDRVVNGKPQFQAGTEIFFDQEPLEIIEDLRLACNARFAEVGGALKVLVGLPGAAVFNFTDDMVIVSSDQELDPFPSLSDTHNTIAATYPEPNERWAMKDAPEYIAAEHVTADGRSLRNALAFEAVPFSAQVQHLQKTMEEDGRRFIVHELTMPPSARLLEPLDCVAWSSLHNNYSNKLFLIIRITRLRGSFQRVLMKEVDPDDYDPPAVILPPSTGWIGPIAAPPQPMTGWAVEPATVKDAGGVDRRPAIKISCAADLDDVKNVWVQVRVKATGEIVFDSDSTAYAEPFSWLISGAWCLPATEYEVSGQYVPYTNRQTTRSAWLSVTTPSVLISSSDILDASITAQKIANAAVTADKIMDEAINSLKLAAGAVTSAKLAVAAVTAAAIAVGAVVSDKLADAAVTAQKLANEAVTATKFASDIKPVEVKPSLPTTGNVEGRQVYNTTDGKVYRYKAGAWTADVAAGDIIGQIVANQLGSGSVTNAKLAALAVDASKLASNAVTETKIADGAITTPKIVASAIVGDHIAANAISVTKLIMADFNNRVENPNFGEGDVGWVKSPGAAIVNNAANAYTGSYYLDFPTGMASGVTRNANIFPVVPGEVYRVYAVGRAVGTPNTYLNVRLRFMQADKSTLVGATSALTFVATDGAYVGKTGQVTVPAGAVYAWLDFVPNVNITAGSYRVGFVSCQRKDAAELVVDGAILANHLAADSVTADKLAANSVVAGKIAVGAVSTDQLAAGAVTAIKIAAAAISADKLAVGRGANYIENSDLYAGLSTWGVRYSNALSAFEMDIRTDTYAANGAAIQMRHNRAVAGEVCDLWPLDAATGTGKNYPVEAGKRYEFSIYGFAHRAERQLYIGWVDAAGAVTYAATGAIAAEGGNPQQLLSNYTRSNLFATAPASAVKAHVFVRHRGTSSGTTDSYVWFRNAYFGEAGPNQTEPSPWSPSGTTLVDAGQIVTGAVIADKIATNAVTAGKISAGAVTATTIATGAVTTDKLAANSVTAAKVAADAIGANHIAANSITAKQLVLTDFENLVPNGYFNDGTVAAWGGVSGTAGNFYATSAIVQTGAYAANLQKDASALSGSINVTMLPEYDIAVTAGEVLYGEASICTNGTATSAGAYYRVNFYDGAKSFLSSLDIFSNAAIPNSWTRYTRKITVPANARYARVQLFNHNTQTTTSNLLFDRLILRRAKAAELIVDGSIVANHLATNSVTADKINVSNLSAISATLGTVNISSAVIGSLQVARSNIIGGAISRVDYAAPAGVANVLTSDTAITGLTATHGTDAQAVIVHTSFSISGTNDTSGFISIVISIWDSVSNAYVALIPLTFKSGTHFSHEFNFTPPGGQSSTQFRFDARTLSGTNVVATNRTIRIMTLYR